MHDDIDDDEENDDDDESSLVTKRLAQNQKMMRIPHASPRLHEIKRSVIRLGPINTGPVFMQSLHRSCPIFRSILIVF